MTKIGVTARRKQPQASKKGVKIFIGPDEKLDYQPDGNSPKAPSRFKKK